MTANVYSLVLTLLSTLSGIDLKESNKAEDCAKVTIELSVKGDLKVQRETKSVSIPLAGTASHVYFEKILGVKSEGLPTKVARKYKKAEATFKVDGNTTQRKLREERSLCVAQKPENKLYLYSPQGALTREELELTSEHFDSLSLAGLLSGKEAKTGETWKIPEQTIQSICNFEGIENHDVNASIIDIGSDNISIKIEGSAIGVESGAQVKSTISGKATFAIKQGVITELSWKQTDDRDQGPINPASKTEMTVELKREICETPQELSESALVSIPEGFQVPQLMTYLEYRDGESRFEMTMNRDWQIVAKTQNHLVMRLVEKGDFIAQATISSWSKAPPGQHLSIPEFKTIIERTPGWVTEKELQEGEVPQEEKGRFVYRTSVLGQLENIPTIQNYFLVAAPTGEQLIVTFSLNPKQSEKLGTKDLSLIGSLELPASKAK